jgi:hypothetical protein
MSRPFSDFDFTDFWEESEYAEKAYQDDPLTDEMVKAAEAELGYKLPLSYVTLMRNRNGGIPKNTSHPMTERTSWSENHISITGIMGIGWEASYSICGDMGSSFMIEEWEYPDIGVYVCTTPTAGHNMVLLDYTKCGKQGEPEVVFVDQEDDYKKTFIAKDFETFILGLVNDEVYNTDDEYKPFDKSLFESGEFSPLLKDLIAKEKSIDFDKVLRNLLMAIVEEKTFFALHDDPKSRLCYAIQFYLLSRFQPLKSREQFLKVYPQLIALPATGISTNGYSLDFIEEWFDKRISLKEIRKPFFGSLQFSDEYKEWIFEEIKNYE